MPTADDLRAFIADARGPGAPDIDDVCGYLAVPDWSPAVRAAPPIVRAMAILPTFRGQYWRNGLDGFVWNCRADVPSLVAAFAAIGATRTADLMADCLLAILEQDDEPDREDLAARDVVADYLALRAARGGPAFGPWLDFDPIAEVHAAILAYLDAHAADVVAGRYPE